MRTSDRLRAAGITSSKKQLPTGIQTLSSSSDEVLMYVFKNYTQVVDVYSFFYICLAETRRNNGGGVGKQARQSNNFKKEGED